MMAVPGNNEQQVIVLDVSFFHPKLSALNDKCDLKSILIDIRLVQNDFFIPFKKHDFSWNNFCRNLAKKSLEKTKSPFSGKKQIRNFFVGGVAWLVTPSKTNWFFHNFWKKDLHGSEENWYQNISKFYCLPILWKFWCHPPTSVTNVEIISSLKFSTSCPKSSHNCFYIK